MTAEQTPAQGARTSARQAITPAAVAALGLVSAWSGQANASAFALNCTITITVGDAAVLYTPNGTTTIDWSSGAEVDAPLSGTIRDLPITFNKAPTLVPVGEFQFMGRIDNGDGTSDLVLAFPGDGSAAIDVAWTALFVDNLPDEHKVFEPQVLAQLAASPVFDANDMVEETSQIARLDVHHRDLLVSKIDQTATLIAFSGPGNTGVPVGTVQLVPTPAGVVCLVAAGMGVATRRRRG